MTVIDGHVLHPRVVTRPQRGVVKQRMDRDDDVGPITEEEVAQAFAVERLAEAHQRAIAAAAVRGIVERAVDRAGRSAGPCCSPARAESAGKRSGRRRPRSGARNRTGSSVSSSAAAIAFAALR